MGIQREEPVGMIQDYNESVPFQPVCIDDAPGHHGMNQTPLGRTNFNPFALNIRVKGGMFLPSEERHHLSFGRPGQRPADATWERGRRGWVQGHGPPTRFQVLQQVIHP